MPRGKERERERADGAGNKEGEEDDHQQWRKRHPEPSREEEAESVVGVTLGRGERSHHQGAWGHERSGSTKLQKTHGPRGMLMVMGAGPKQ